MSNVLKTDLRKQEGQEILALQRSTEKGDLHWVRKNIYPSSPLYFIL